MNRNQFSGVAGKLPVPVMLVSVEGKLLSANAPARHALGDVCLPNEDLVARAADPNAFRGLLKRGSRSGSPLPGKVSFDGGEISMRCDVSAILCEGDRAVVVVLRPSNDAVVGFTALNHRIERLQSEIRRREQLEAERHALLVREREARKRADEANRFKDELLATISHEFRTPLQAIAGWVSIIRENPHDHDRLMRGLEVIERNVRAEVQLTEDLVDTSLLVSGRMRLSTCLVDLPRIIIDAVDSARPTAAAKDVEIEIVGGAGEFVVDGDPDRLLQVVWNLLANAIKFTPAGGKVQVTLRRAKSNVEIGVSDSGAGISRELLPHVFEPFRRGDASRTRRQGGMGLGLAIVKRLVELHHGVVFVDSEGLGHGATFFVSLPTPAFDCSEAVQPGAGASVPGESLANIHVLLVEDHDDSREMLAMILGSHGASLDAVGCSMEAQSAFRRRTPDIIVSDIEMPGEDGFTLMRKLRELEQELGRVPAPAISVSAHAFPDAQVRSLRAGFQGFLPKPIQPPELLALISTLCPPRSTT